MALEVNKEEEELKSCTFQPQMFTKNRKVSAKPKKSKEGEEDKKEERPKTTAAPRRSQKEFLESQQKFLDMKKDRIKQQESDMYKKDTNAKKMSEKEWLERFAQRKDNSAQK